MKALRLHLAAALCGLMVVAGYGPARALEIGEARIAIAPSQPSEDDDISITASGEWPNACVPGSPQVSIVGNEIRIATFSPGEICAAVIAGWSVTVEVGSLAAGPYRVTVTNEGFRPPPRVIGEATVQVSGSHYATPEHFKCYRVRGEMPRHGVSLLDRFEQETRATVLRPVVFCTPVDKNGEGIENPDDHLTCYETRPPARPPRLGRRAVIVDNQFGQQSLDVVARANLLCVPSRAREATTCAGIGGLMCPKTQACDLRDATCSIVDLGGICVPRPALCVQTYDPVCGCDGHTYASDCERLRAGAVLAHAGECR